MKHKVLQLCVLLMLAGTTLAAQGKIEFNDPIHDFGTILEKDGDVSYTFTFSNKGNQPIILSSVTPSCGCTTPSWTKEPILPGKTGTITATYNPLGRPGPFDKSLTVISNGNPTSVLLRIKGEVVQKIPTVEEKYPVVVGSLRLQSSTIAFARLINTETKTEAIEVYNSGTSPATVSFGKLPAHLSVKVEPSTIAAKQKATITCTYQASAKNDWGSVTDKLAFKVTSGKKITNGNLDVAATIMEDFSKLSPAEMDNAPYPQFKTTSYNFANVTQGAVITYSFSFTNTGKSDLQIRKIATESASVKGTSSKNVVKPGESADINISIATKDQSGIVAYSISVFSNSPRVPQLSLLVSGSILK